MNALDIVLLVIMSAIAVLGIVSLVRYAMGHKMEVKPPLADYDIKDSAGNIVARHLSSEVPNVSDCTPEEVDAFLRQHNKIEVTAAYINYLYNNKDLCKKTVARVVLNIWTSHKSDIPTLLYANNSATNIPKNKELLSGKSIVLGDAEKNSYDDDILLDIVCACGGIIGFDVFKADYVIIDNIFDDETLEEISVLEQTYPSKILTGSDFLNLIFEDALCQIIGEVEW